MEKEEKCELEALMAEGYKEMAEENRREAEEWFPLVSETILKYTEWDERVGDSRDRRNAKPEVEEDSLA